LRQIAPIILICFFLACDTPAPRTERVPAWSKGAVWYQIFPERFRNGDPTNDPTAADAGIANYPAWQISPWTSDWYELQPWERARSTKFYDAVFARRYGGDLQGMIDRLDYLASLNIDAIYLNPVFDARSMHKYEAATFHHIDHNFGPNPSGDRQLIAHETNDPETWQWTSADTLFLCFVREAHARNIKVILDGVFNHVGTDFWAFRDVREKGKASPYAHWFVVRTWDDPATREDEFDYQGFWDLRSMPVFRENEMGLVSGPREYIFAITKRWMDPNNDGDPSDGVDGWRLDALSEMTKEGFWVEWCKLVREINPKAYTAGEIWGVANDWLDGTRFDAVMNYPVAYAMRNFFIGGEEKWNATRFDRELLKIRSTYREHTNYVMQVLIDSHDTERVGSMIKNDSERGYDQRASLRDNPDYDPTKPNADELRTQKMIAAFQAVYVGAPMLYYGDEAGMWGGDDPDCRKPMVWDDLEYQPETFGSVSKYSESDSVRFDAALYSYYQKLFALRRKHQALREGSLQTSFRDDEKGVIAFRREHGDDVVFAVFNAGASEANFNLPIAREEFEFSEVLSERREQVRNHQLPIAIGAREAQIWERVNP